MSIQQLPQDPNVKIPLAVKALAAKADHLHATIIRGEAPPDPSLEPPPAPTPDPAPAPTPDPAPAPELAATTPPAEPTPPTPPTPPAPRTYTEREYKGLEGRLRAAQDQLRDLTAEVATLRAAPPAPPPAPATPTPTRLLTDDEVNEYGAELLGVVKKAAKEELNPEVEQLKGTVKQLQDQIQRMGGHVERDAKTRFFETLDKSLSNWREINEDERFISWLALKDDLSGAIRHELLKSAVSALDARRALAFFNGFLAQEAATGPVEDEPHPTPEPNAPARIPLENLAAPGRAKSAAATAPAEKPQLTRAQIAGFYADVSAGKYRGREEEKDRLERVIFEAQRDGRIR